MQLFDRFTLGPAAEIAGARPLGNGALVVQARAARAGNVQVYRGDEVARPDLAQVRIYRDPDEIFRPESLRSFGHKPVTLDHPPEAVTPRTWRGVARGHVGDEVVRDGAFVRIPMLLADSAAIAAVQAGRREVSVGYACDLDWTPGTTPDGEPYDARQTRVVVDHVAIVAQGRAGPECRIGDADLARRLADAEARAQAAETRAQAAETALAQRDGEVAALRARVPNEAALDALAAERGALVAQARRILGDAFDPAGLTPEAIRRAAVARALGEADAAAMGAAALEGAFRVIAAGPPPAADPLRDALRDRRPDALTPEAAHAAMVETLRTAWKPAGAR
ncbi:DUF2213 domain-containing protein [Methylobacterium nonmethylotrophicum]|uniref:DUF2213 domain-containing protein n=1 Tax=Methylobacterium nonmethylotrophicum TaxID=1141884 RepID=A0A4Z0NJF7_9HYPH|nr:DUF2213 domain-containing protein [Methylobacterium nonmethylotrophicum]TGD96467.1 DUF2213 domain-containing protein [Methylobacterium nonmethylotrophicum]